MSVPVRRPFAVSAVSAFFACSAVVSLLASASLLLPVAPLVRLWRLNPRAQEAFGRLGALAPVLLLAVSVACGGSAVGLWRGTRWGRRLGLCLLAMSFVGDFANATLGKDARAAIGLQVAAAMAAYLWSERAGQYFPARMLAPRRQL